MIQDLYTYKATIESVYDGDTVTAKIDLGFKISITEKVRLFGINTPEIRGSEREKGLISRDKLRELILGKEVFINSMKDKKGKYGRYLGTLFISKGGRYINVNDWLVEQGLAEKKDY